MNSIKRLQRDSNRWSIFTLTIVFVITFPILFIFLKLFSGPGETWGHLVKNVLGDYVANSLYLIIGCTIITIIAGVTSAWLVSRYRFPLQKQLQWCLILPLAIPSYITAYAYAGIFDYGGFVQNVFQFFGLSQGIKIDVMNTWGLIWVLSFSLYPYVYVSSRAVFLSQTQNLIEASWLLRTGGFKTFFKIVLPLARPAIVGGVLLVLMEVLNDYGAAKYYGVSTFTTGIFRAWFALEEPETAVYLSAILVLVIFGLIGLERWQRRGKKYHSINKVDRVLPLKRVKGYQKWLLLSIVILPFLFGFAIPVMQLLYWAFLTFEKVYKADFLILALQSFTIALSAAIAIVIVAVMIIYFSNWSLLAWIRRTAKTSTFGYAVPGAVIAVGVMIPTLVIDKTIHAYVSSIFNKNIGLLINGTAFGLIYAYTVRFLAVGYNPIESSVLKVGFKVSESSRILGASRWRTFFRIDIPLIRNGVLSGLLLVFVDVMKELPLTLILKPYDINTLAIRAYEYASDELIAEAALPSLCIILTGILPILLLNRLISRS